MAEQQRTKAAAEVVVLRDLLEELLPRCVDRDGSTPEPDRWVCLECYGRGQGEHWECITHEQGCAVEGAMVALQSPTTGAALLARLKKLEGAAVAARCYADAPHHGAMDDAYIALDAALKALEEDTNNAG